jgi:DNA polymerase-3 subunit delta
MAAPAVTYDSICRQLAAKQFAPVYLLHGDEGYYIDELVRRFENILSEEEREFNLHVLYAPEVEPGAVMDLCMQYPMMADRQVVILKEAQSVPADRINKLHRYVASPAETTILVICCRGAQARGKELLAAVRAKGVNFESKKLSDYNAPAVIGAFIKAKGLKADPKALDMLIDYVGTDLSRLYNEIDKLMTALGAGATVTAEAVERNIGMSKDYNNFELVDALAVKDSGKVFRIADYFRSNPKNNPLVVSASTIFSFFADLLAAYYCADKSDNGIMAELKLRWPGQIKRYRAAMQRYNAFQVIEIIAAIRRYDAMSKGVGSRQSDHNLFHDLLFHILTAPGNIKF